MRLRWVSSREEKAVEGKRRLRAISSPRARHCGRVAATSEGVKPQGERRGEAQMYSMWCGVVWYSGDGGSVSNGKEVVERVCNGVCVP